MRNIAILIIVLLTSGTTYADMQGHWKVNHVTCLNDGLTPSTDDPLRPVEFKFNQNVLNFHIPICGWYSAEFMNKWDYVWLKPYPGQSCLFLNLESKVLQLTTHQGLGPLNLAWPTSQIDAEGKVVCDGYYLLHLFPAKLEINR